MAEPVSRAAKAKNGCLGLCFTVPLWLFALLASVWALSAIWNFPGFLNFQQQLTTAAAALSIAVVLLLFRGVSRPLVLIGLAMTLVTPVFLIEPRSDRFWTPAHGRQASATFDGSLVTIHNLRDWPNENPWIDRSYDLSDVVGVDYVIKPFAKFRGLAHTFVTFRFGGGTNLSVSVEARREVDEEYDPVRGLYRNFELLYVVGTEKDLIGSRLKDDKPIYIIPILASAEQAQLMLRSMLVRANRLGAAPEFYDTLFENCTTSVIRHANLLRRQKISLTDWRVVLPGFADDAAFELRLIDFDGSLAEARRRFRVAGPVDMSPREPAWSAAIRGLPEP